MGDKDRTQRIAVTLKTARANAEAFLWAEMARLNLTRADGWSIVEFTRERSGGTEIVMRPMHLTLPSPEGIECVVSVQEDSGDVGSHCTDGRE